MTDITLTLTDEQTDAINSIAADRSARRGQVSTPEIMLMCFVDQLVDENKQLSSTLLAQVAPALDAGIKAKVDAAVFDARTASWSPDDKQAAMDRKVAMAAKLKV